MPELPEVEVVRAGLEPGVASARVSAVDVLDERALTRHRGTAADFMVELTGSTIGSVVRRGKFLWMPLAGTDRAVVGHLGMSGQLLLREPDAPTERHERIRIFVDHPEHGELAVVFADQRTFGSMAIDDLIPTAEPGGFGSAEHRVPHQVAHIARDPLDDAFDLDAVIHRFSRSGSAIKRALLNQNLVSGIGNIYADEALFQASIHPETPTNVLTAAEITELFADIRSVLTRALAEGGTSFDAQYVNVNGQAGYFARRLNVYGCQGLPCERCGTPIVREHLMNRSSHFCPSCQRKR